MPIHRKPLAFGQFRVLIDPSHGVYRRTQERRSQTDPFVELDSTWRKDGTSPPAVAQAPLDTETNKHVMIDRARPPVTIAETTADVASELLSPPDNVFTGVHPRPQDGEHREGARGDEAELTPQSQTIPVVPCGQDVAVISAVTRLVNESRKVSAIVDLIVETCGGEDKRDSGPWAFALSLQPHGMPDTTLNVRLSHQSLILRFTCGDPETCALLSRHCSSLRDQLDAQIKPPVQVDIAVTEV